MKNEAEAEAVRYLWSSVNTVILFWRAETISINEPGICNFVRSELQVEFVNFPSPSKK